MTTLQRVIKGCAIAFAIVLVVTVFGSILAALVGLTEIFGKSNTDEAKANEKAATSFISSQSINKNITELDIDLSAAELKIFAGDSFAVKTDNENVIIKSDNGTLKIKEKSSKLKLGSSAKLVEIQIPKNTVFTSADIETGAGKTTIDELIANEIDFELGAGKATINSVTALNEADISTGAGKTSLNNCSLNNLELELGVGKTTLNGSITGICKIEHGIGKLKLNIDADIDDYTLKLDKGFGQVKINDKKITDSITVGGGKNIMDIDCGIGKIDVHFAK